MDIPKSLTAYFRKQGFFCRNGDGKGVPLKSCKKPVLWFMVTSLGYFRCWNRHFTEGCFCLPWWVGSCFQSYFPKGGFDEGIFCKLPVNSVPSVVTVEASCKPRHSHLRVNQGSEPLSAVRKQEQQSHEGDSALKQSSLRGKDGPGSPCAHPCGTQSCPLCRELIFNGIVWYTSYLLNRDTCEWKIC